MSGKCKLKHDNTQDEIYEAFRCFDQQNTGFVEAAEFRQAMTQLGEALTDQEYDMMLFAAGVKKDGKIEYARIVKYFFPQ